VSIFKTRNDKEKPEVEYTTGANIGSIFYHEGNRLLFTLEEGKPMAVGYENDIEVPKTIVISCLGGGNSAIIKNFIESCVDYNQAKEDGLTQIFEKHPWDWMNGWIKSKNKLPRPMESVILDKGIA
jgi:hypothetical protein